MDLNELNRRCDEALARSTELVAEARRPVASSSTTVRAGSQEAPETRAFSIQARSANPKLAPQRSETAKSGRNRYVPTGPYCISTYASIAATCPHSCPFRDNGCFAQAGAMHLTMGSLDRHGRRTRGLQVSLAEAEGLRGLWRRRRQVPQDGARGGRDLRLHVGGDVSCSRGAQALGEAVGELKARGLRAAWTYTHRWREIPRAAFGPINVLASTEHPRDIEVAADRGYASAITVDRFTSRKAFTVAPGWKAIPCPFEAGGDVTCVQCRLCLEPDLLRMRRVIAFAVHGAMAEQATDQLVKIRRR
jgi:hypothetical protein